MAKEEETILRIVGDHLGVPASTLSLDAHLVDDLGADSLDRLELLMTIEEYLGVRFTAQQPAPERIRDVVAALASSPGVPNTPLEKRKP